MRGLGARIVGVAAITGWLASSAYAQFAPSFALNPTVSKTQEEKDADAVRDKAYRESLKKIPDAKAPPDPWGVARSVDTSKADTAKSTKTDASKTDTSKPTTPAKPQTKPAT
jgi:hypothetical protein